MNNLNDYSQNFQKAAQEGLGTLVDWQKQALAQTFSMVDQGIATQEKSLVESRKQYKEWETNLTREWGNQKDQFTSIMVKLSETYLPDSKKHMDQAEKLYRENFGEMISNSRELVENSIDQGIENSLNFEKECFSKLRENYSIVADNLLKQFGGLMPSFSSSAKAASPKKPVGKTVGAGILFLRVKA